MVKGLNTTEGGILTTDGFKQLTLSKNPNKRLTYVLGSYPSWLIKISGQSTSDFILKTCQETNPSFKTPGKTTVSLGANLFAANALVRILH